jgi:hypothetical protein
MKIFFLVFLSLQGLNAMTKCPDVTLNESQSDCPWASMAKSLITENKSCEEVFKKSAPSLLPQLKSDSKNTAFINLWGKAKNFDENAKGVIVDKKILICLAEKLKIRNAVTETPEFMVVHAGMQHSFGYLFSNLLTKYGYKRDRWTKEDIKSGLGLQSPLISPTEKNGSFLSNITFLFSKLTFGTSGLDPKLVRKDITDLDISKFTVRHLRETLGHYAIHTTFVKFKATAKNSKNTHLLIYWIEDLKNKKFELISGFPVDTETVEKAFDPAGLGENKPVSTRYNAWVPSISDSKETLKGLREEVK